MRGLYISWQNMKQRCTNKNHPKYHRYGGRGITLFDGWVTIQGFMEWALENGWKAGLTIDRINNDGPYAPDNCRFVTISDNARRKSTTKLTKQDAKNIRDRISLGESEYLLADEYGVVHGTIWFIKNKFTHVDDGECTKKLKEAKTK
jgi:hypothetical protein